MFTAGSTSSSNASSENTFAGQTSATSSTVTHQCLAPTSSFPLSSQASRISRMIPTLESSSSDFSPWFRQSWSSTPSFLLGSPLDHLPNLPLLSPHPPRVNNPALHQCEGYVKEKSAAAEMHWATNGADTSTNSIIPSLFWKSWTGLCSRRMTPATAWTFPTT